MGRARRTAPAARASWPADADLVVNATNGLASLAALGEVGSDHLAGKVLVDVANPLDFSQGFPPTLSVKDTDSLAEQIQRAFPDARVVKALNTVTASVMVDPRLGRRRGHHDLRGRRRRRGRDRWWSGCCGSSAGATSSSSTGLQNARGLEMWMPLWVRLMGALGTAEFNLKLVR